MAILRNIIHKFDFKKNIYARHLSNQPNFGFLFDIDGVIIRGKEVIPTVPEKFKQLIGPDNKFRVPTVFVTNSGDALRSSRAADLTRWLGVKVDEKQVVLSHSPLSLFKEYHDKRLLISGQGNVHEIASNLGFKNIVLLDEIVKNFPSLDYINKAKRNPINGPVDPNFKKIDGIILLNEPINWETSLQLLVDLLMTNGMPVNLPPKVPDPHLFISACNVDLIWSSKAPLPRYGHGAFLHCLESLYKKITGNDIRYSAIIGKPSIITYCFANDLLAEHAKSIGINHNIDTIYAVGDNLNTDVCGANLYQQFLETHESTENNKFDTPELVQRIKNNGPKAKRCQSVLVESGVHKRDSEVILNHSHKDFMRHDKNICKPVICAVDAGCAIDIVFKEEKFK